MPKRLNQHDVTFNLIFLRQRTKKCDQLPRLRLHHINFLFTDVN